MRKRLISVCIVMLLVYSIYGCAQTAENTLASETENVGLEDTEIKSVEMADTGDPESEDKETRLLEGTSGIYDLPKCTCMTACGNADRQSANEQSGVGTVEPESTETEGEEADPADAETESEAANAADAVENKKEQRFIPDESMSDLFERANAERDIHADIKDENYIDAEQVILDFINMNAIEFQENYDREDLYQSGILYCGHETWKYDGNQVDAYQEPGDYYDVVNVTAIRFYKRQPVPVYLDININDRFGQYKKEISIDYHTDYAVSVYSKPADDNLSYIQEISFVKIEPGSGKHRKTYMSS